MFNSTGKQAMYADKIDFINTRKPTVVYDDELYEEVEDAVEQFVADLSLGDALADNIGGLIVYTRADTVVAVYDYELFCGWVV